VILEGLVTTRNPDGSVNVAPQGPITSAALTTLTFRPFPESNTYANLQRERRGVFHLVDDVLLLAQTALDLPHPPPSTEPAARIDGQVLRDCCRWCEFVIERIDLTGERPVFEARVVHRGWRRDHCGFNRARHAVIEATIAASRLAWLGRDEVLAEIARCRAPVLKTGDEREQEALRLVEEFVQSRVPPP